MISGANLSEYYKVASMSQSLNVYIREAMLTKAQLTSSLIAATTSAPTRASKDIGANVDIFA